MIIGYVNIFKHDLSVLLLTDGNGHKDGGYNECQRVTAVLPEALDVRTKHRREEARDQ